MEPSKIACFCQEVKQKNIPTIVVLEGNIGAGKTTLLTFCKIDAYVVLESVEEMLHPVNLLELAYTNPFLSCIMKIMKQQMLNILKNKNKSVILMERGIYSCEMFINVAYIHGNILLKERDLLLLELKNVIHDLQIPPIPAGFIYLDTPIVQCVENIHKRKRRGEEKLDRDYLEILAQEQRKHMEKQEKVLHLKYSQIVCENRP